MGIKIITNMFFDIGLLYSDEDYMLERCAGLDVVTGIEYQPLLNDKLVVQVTQLQLFYKDLANIAGIYKRIHSSNDFCLITDSRSLNSIKSFFLEKGITATYINGKYLPKPLFEDYCAGLGLHTPDIVDTLYKRMYGNLDASAVVILKLLSTNISIDRLVAPRASSLSYYFLAIFLGLYKSTPACRQFGKILRDEHPNYMRAILTSQLQDFITLQEKRDEIASGKYDYKKKNISRKFFFYYQDRIGLFADNVLRDINKRVQACSSKADLLLLHHKIINEKEINIHEEVNTIRCTHTL